MDCTLKTIKVWYNTLRRTEIMGGFFVFMDRKINIIKIPYSKAFHKFNAGHVKNLIVFFTKIEKNNSEICVESQNNTISKKNIEKEKENWRYRAS